MVRGRSLCGLADATDVCVLVAPLELQREVTAKAEAAQRVAHLVGVGAHLGRRLPHIFDKRVEACVEVGDVGDLAYELVEGLAECTVQRRAPLSFVTRDSRRRYHRAADGLNDRRSLRGA